MLSGEARLEPSLSRDFYEDTSTVFTKTLRCILGPILTLFVQQDTPEFHVSTLLYTVTELLSTFSHLILTTANFLPFFSPETKGIKVNDSSE